MFKYIAVICAIIACTVAKPSVFAPVALNAAPVALNAAPVAFASPIVTTGTSSQYQEINHNIATPVVASAPLVAAPAAYAAAPFAYASPFAASYAYTNSLNVPYAGAYYV